MDKLKKFDGKQISVINSAVEMAEELVCNYYKMSVNQWLRNKYDVKTLVDLQCNEIVFGPFAQIIRYSGQKKDTSLGSMTYDFYKICLQDHSIIPAINQFNGMNLFSFSLYIIIHELIHIVRFSKFLINFNASSEEKIQEEIQVHEKTHEIIKSSRVSGLAPVIEYYKKWRPPLY